MLRKTKLVGVGGCGALPQTEVELEVRKGKMNVSQEAQPDPGSSCQAARGFLSPEGRHSQTRKVQQSTPSDSMSPSRCPPGAASGVHSVTAEGLPSYASRRLAPWHGRVRCLQDWISPASQSLTEPSRHCQPRSCI